MSTFKFNFAKPAGSETPEPADAAVAADADGGDTAAPEPCRDVAIAGTGVSPSVAGVLAAWRSWAAEESRGSAAATLPDAVQIILSSMPRRSTKRTVCDASIMACVPRSDVLAGESKAAEASKRVDVKRGVLEGGQKVWECSVDLLLWLRAALVGVDAKDATAEREAKAAVARVLREGGRVLEIGCGAALPGIACGLSGADVTLCDLNAEVLEQTTAPNIAANAASCAVASARSGQAGSCESTFDEIVARFGMVSGDWAGLGGHLTSAGFAPFDLILASETIYRPEETDGGYTKQMALLDACLSEHGVAIFAAKRLYFGVGGGTRSFAGFASRWRGTHTAPAPVGSGGAGGAAATLPDKGEAAGASWVVTTAGKKEDGASNIRELLIIRRA